MIDPALNYRLSLSINLAIPIAASLAALMTSGQSAPFAVVLAWCVGIWTYWLIEYLGHRAFHVISLGHQAHHDDPRAPVAMPFWVGTAAHFVALNIVWWLFDLPVALAFVMGSSLAYAFYCVLHESMHSAPAMIKRLAPQLYKHHALHHARGDVNFGVSTWFFDWFFGTLEAPSTKKICHG